MVPKYLFLCMNYIFSVKQICINAYIPYRYPRYFSSDPDPAQLKKTSGSSSGSDLIRNGKKKNICVLGRWA